MPDNGAHDIEQGNALIEFFLQKDPLELSIDEWAKSVNTCLYGLKVLQRVIWSENQ